MEYAMSETISSSQFRFRFEEAKFFYEQMKQNFQDRAKFLYFLDAFLASARSVTQVFEKEFHDNQHLMNLYNNKCKEWENNKIMKFVREMRNISLKEHTPKTQVTAAVGFHISVTIVDKVSIKKISPSEKIENVEVSSPEPSKQTKEEEQAPQTTPRIVSYSFSELPEWFDENPDVMNVCKSIWMNLKN